MVHGQGRAPLAAARGEDGATGPRTHAQPEAVDLRATPVVRLVRTLAHCWLQGRLRKVLRQTPRICGVTRCMSHGRAAVWARAQAIIGISTKKIRSPPAMVKSDRTTTTAHDMRKAGPSRTGHRGRRPPPSRISWRHPSTVCERAHGNSSRGHCRRPPGSPCGQVVVHRRVRLPPPPRAVDNLCLWITSSSLPPTPSLLGKVFSYTPCELQFVDNHAPPAGICHPVDNPVENLWTTLRSCGYPQVVKASASSTTAKLSTSSSGQGALPAPAPSRP